MSHKEFRPNADYAPWGPFIPDHFKNETILNSDIIIASIVWGLTLINSIIAVWLGYKQSTSSRSPLRSVYVWMVWLELASSFVMGIVCYLHLLKIIDPSFALYFVLISMWCIQTQLLLQIIINRIRVIVPDRSHSKMIMVTTAVIMTVINISVFNLWVPARLQISPQYILANTIWDRIEKVIYLIMDGGLNWYFLKVVKANLVNNGLEKYNKLLRFNQRIILVSLLMDIMIIAAMSIPNSLVYVQFHPLAYIVKLNIEMVMANLIKRIAISSSRKMGNAARVHEEFDSSNLSSKGKSGSNSRSRGTHRRRSSLIELSSNAFATKSFNESKGNRAVSFTPAGNQIKVTEDVFVQSEPNPEFGSAIHDDGPARGLKVGQGVDVVIQSKSLDDVSEGHSVKSEYGQGKGDSDDEAALVIHGRGERWTGR